MFKKLYLFLTLLTAFLWLGSGTMWGETLTVADGSATNEYVPHYGYYGDAAQQNQFIIPASDLEDIQGGTITGLKFYLSSTAAWSSKGAPTATIRLTEVDVTTLSAYSASGASGTKVWEGPISYSSNEWNITFTTSYVYSDKNLLVDIQTTSAGYAHNYFLGVAKSDNTAYTYSAARKFLPKTTLTYTPEVVTCPKPQNLVIPELTMTSASFSWDAGDSETSWQYICLPAATAVNWNDASVQTTSSKSATVTGLTNNTSYIFYVRADCGGSQSRAKSIKFKTDHCAKKALPYDEDFEGMTAGSTSSAAPDCWDMINANKGAYPYIYVSNKSGYKNGDLGLYFTSSSSKAAFIVLPSLAAPTNLLKVSFKHREESTSTSCGQISIGYITDIDDASTFTAIQTLNRTASLTTVSNVLFTSAPPHARIAFCYAGTADNWYAGIDDIHVESTQDCSKPTTPTYSALTGNSVTINWTANAGVTDYKYINVDRTENPDYELDWENDATLVESATSVDLEGLTDGHNYEFYVMCACGTVASDACTYQPLSCPNVTEVSLSNQLWNGVTINWTTSAKTNCDVQYKAGSGEWQTAETNTSATSKVISGLSVGTEYSFRVKPNCSADGWVSPASTYTPACPELGALTLSGEKYNGVTVSWNEVAGISKWNLKYRKGEDSWTEVNNIAALTYTIEFGLVTNEEYTIELQSECEGSWSSTTYTPEYAAPGSVVAAPRDLRANPNWLAAEGATGYQWICVAKDAAHDWASATSVGSSVLTVEVTSLHASTSYDFYVRAVYPGENQYSAEVKKNFTTGAHGPNTPTIADEDITPSSAVVTWTNNSNGDANRYQWACKKTSEGAPADEEWTLLATDVLTASPSNLIRNTDYTFYVRSYFEEGVYSSNVTKSFKTKFGVATLPFSENFYNNANIPAGWTCSRWQSSSSGYWYSEYQTYPNYYMKYYANSSSTTAEFITPQINVSDAATFSFTYTNYYKSGYYTYYAGAEVVITNGTTTKTIALANTTSASTFTSKSIDLTDVDGTDFTGDTVTIKFVGKKTSSGTSYFKFDDVNIAVKPIAAPTSLEAVPTTDGALVSWIHDENGPFELRYRVKDAEPEAKWDTIIINNAKSYTITGLTPSTEYEVQVRANISANRVSSWTSSVDFTPECIAPVGLTKDAETYNSIELSWIGDAKALRYKTDGDWTNVPLDPVATSYTIEDMNPGDEYTIQVQAACATDDTKWSEEFAFTPNCVAPTAVQVDSKTASSATISWTASNGETAFRVQYKKDGDADWTTVNDVATPYEITGLSAASHYAVQVAACNGVYVAVEGGFDTNCPDNYALPFVENFNGLTAGIPLCWDNTEGTTTVDEYKWNMYATGHEGKCVRFDSYNNNTGYSVSNNTNILKTPALAIGTDEVGYRLEFWYKNPNGGDFSVYYSINGTKQETPLVSGLTGQTDWKKVKYDLPAACNGQNVVIMFQGTSNWGSSDAYIYLDDVKVSRKPTCLEPTNLAASAISTNGATITWTKGSDETAWKLQYKSDGDWSEAINVATTASHNLSVLTPNTVYYVRVMANCTSEDSEYTDGTFSFRTECEAQDMPFSEAFGTTLPDCWKTAQSGADAWEPSTSRYVSSNRSMQFNANTATENYADLITPTIDVDDESTLKFQLWNSSYSAKVTGALYYNQVDADHKIMDLPETSAWEQQTVDLGEHNLIGQEVKFIFRAYGNNTSYTYMNIDDVEVKVKPCDAPTFAASNVVPTVEGATITCAADAWSLRYRTGSAEWTEVLGLTESPYEITGCEFGTTYEVQVRTDCSATRHSDWTASQNFVPACLAPTAVEASNISANSATISWTGAAKALRYKTGDADWSNETLSNATSFNLTSLAAQSTYTVQVKAACEDEDNWSASLEFTTACGLASAEELPLNEDFSAGEKPACWQFITTSEYPQIANNKIWFQGTAEQIVVFPGFDINLNQLAVSFDYTANSASIEFGYFPVAGGAFQSLGAYTSGKLLDLTSAPAAKGYLAVRYYNATNGNMSTGSVDNVHVTRHLTLADGVDNTNTLNTYKNKTVDVTLGRTIFCDGDYNTICLPFDLATLDGTPLEGATVKAFKYAVIEPEELQVRVINVEGGLEAGVPYLLKMTADENLVSPLFKNVTISATAGKTIGQDQPVEFIGTFAPVAFAAGDENTLFVYTNNNLTWAGKDGTSLKAFRAYFDRSNNPSSAPLRRGMRARIVEHEEVATGINNTNVENVTLKFIENDQVVIIRNGVKYNIQGQVIEK